jgi:hypothetical protein
LVQTYCFLPYQVFSEKVYADDALTIAWRYVLGKISGWTSGTYKNQANVYKRIIKLPRGAVYFAGGQLLPVAGMARGSGFVSQIGRQIHPNKLDLN